jgi:peptide/nickel transport system permease protein
MWKFIIRRTLIMIPQLFILSILIFILAKGMPGDALTGRASNPKADPKQTEALRQQMGLNDPAYVQYVRWMKNALHGDFGVSYTQQIPVKDVIGERINNTIILSFAIFIVTYILAIPLGIISGRWNDTWADRLVTGYNYLGFATPLFIFAIVMLFIFGFYLNFFPTGGSIDPTIDNGTFAYYISKINHLVLPTLSGALISTVGISQYLRSEIIDTKVKDFVRTAKSKGVPESRIYSRHILRNSFLPIAAFLGYEFTNLISGSVFLESIFSYPGLGQLFIKSIGMRDYSVVTALIMMTSFATLIGTLLSDIILSIVDPRIRIE